MLLGVELGQGLLGFVQYFTGLPVVLVALHLVGACLIAVTAVQAVLALCVRAVRPDVPAAEARLTALV